MTIKPAPKWAVAVVCVAAIWPAAARAAPLCVQVPAPSTNDRVAIQTAITSALAAGGPHAVCFAAGTYSIAPGSGNASFNLGNVGGAPAKDLLLIGTGSATVLQMNGNGAGQSWALFSLNNGAARIAFRDLVLDGALATNTPAGRLIQLGSNDGTVVSEISLDGVTLRASRNEAIQIAGAATPTTRLISIRSSAFQANLGAALDIRGGAEQIQVTATTFTSNAGEDVRTRGTPVDSIAVTNSCFVRTSTATAGSISLQGGTAAAPNKHATVANNSFVNGSFDLQHFDEVELANNVLIGSADAGARAEVTLTGRAAATILDGNVVVRTAAGAAPVLAAISNAGVGPTRTVVRGNLLVQGAASTIAQLLSVTDLVFSANQLVFGNASTATASGLQVRSVTVAADRLTIANNVFAGNAGGGTLAAAVQLASSTGFTITHATVTGNVGRGAVHGVLFANTFTNAVVVADNLFDTTDDVSGGFQAIVAGGNRGDPVQLVGTGDPTALAAPSGSTYQRRDNPGSNPTLYVRQGSTWVAK
jgi:hypothetical protein